ncbi:twin-arginine translocation signal domain-containing protein [Streptomyces sp. NPDC088788]|uniref:twin-arginine translocation signal domain-containing protein n=1 Tax=Streptomyces sp. NPDC088788 TaxID=3365898 RepID=UPI00382E3130
MTDRDLTRRRVLALGGAAVGAALGIGLNSCSADPKPDASPGPRTASPPERPDGRPSAPAADTAGGD